MNARQPIALFDQFAKLRFLENRTPDMSSEEREEAFARLCGYRDGALFVGYYAGNSEWERHPQGDEIVLVLEGSTTLYLLSGDEDEPVALYQGDLFVVPRNHWHRFETPDGVKIMTVTPHPTQHSLDRPQAP